MNDVVLLLCSVDNLCFESKYGITSPLFDLMLLSNTFLERIGRNEMGLLTLLLSGCSSSPPFGMGVISAIFQTRGNVPLTNEGIIMAVMVGEIAELSL